MLFLEESTSMGGSFLLFIGCMKISVIEVLNRFWWNLVLVVYT